jgi:hypothetical protein
VTFPYDPGRPPAPAWPYAPAVRPPSTVPAYLTAALFAVCAAESFLFAFVCWDGQADPRVMAAVVGMVFSGRVTGNLDFGIAMTMTVACTTLTFAVILVARLAFARWFLAGLGGLVAAYYACAIVYIVVYGAMSLVGLPMLALLTWSAATTMALLPFTARAMRLHGFSSG